jgi:preprotein translocase subunit YajC
LTGGAAKLWCGASAGKKRPNADHSQDNDTMFPLISEAYAQDASGGLAGSGILQIAPILLIFGIFYFMMIRPQQQQQKALKARLAVLKRGDKVLTAGGIVGVVQKARDGASEIEIEIAPNVRVTVLRETLSQVMTGTTPVPANDAK